MNWLKAEIDNRFSPKPTTCSARIVALPWMTYLERSTRAPRAEEAGTGKIMPKLTLDELRVRTEWHHSSAYRTK